MPDPNPRPGEQDPDHVEPVRVVPATMPVHPHPGGTTQLPLLPPVDRLDRPAEPLSPTSLDLDERHDSFQLDHEIDVPVPAPEPALHHSPAPLPEPSLRYPLAQLPQCLRGR